MSAEKLTAELRTEFGKGAARRTRRDNKIPAVLYGHGADSQHLSLPAHTTMMALRNGGANALLALDIDGTEQLALVKDVQVDPIRRVIEHVDLLAVNKGEKVTVSVPVTLVGDAIKGAIVVVGLTEIEIEAEATHVPEFLEISIAGAQGGTQILAGAIELPKGSSLLTDAAALVVNVTEAAAEAAEEAPAAE